MSDILQAMSTEQTPDEKVEIEALSETERLIGGVHHAVLSENMPFEEAEARLKLIAELNTPDYLTEDK